MGNTTMSYRSVCVHNYVIYNCVCIQLCISMYNCVHIWLCGFVYIILDL